MPNNITENIASNNQPNLLSFEQIEKLVLGLDKGLLRIPYLNLELSVDGLIGLLPWVGDTVTSIISLLIVALLYTPRMSLWDLLAMLLNVAIDYFVGLIPVVGDIFDFYFQANLRNLEIARPYYQ
jgi:hypothetical protein